MKRAEKAGDVHKNRATDEYTGMKQSNSDEQAQGVRLTFHIGCTNFIIQVQPLFSDNYHHVTQHDKAMTAYIVLTLCCSEGTE